MYSGIKKDVRAEVHVENGKATVELSLDSLREKYTDKASDEPIGGNWGIYLWDAQGLPAFYCSHPVREEEPCVMKLLHPHFWQGTEAPYLYRLEICAQEKICEMQLPIRELSKAPGKGLYLNGRPFEQRAVRLQFPQTIEAKEGLRAWFAEDFLPYLVKMGANTVLVDEKYAAFLEEPASWEEQCDRLGLLFLREAEADRAGFSGGSDNWPCIKDLFTARGACTDLYYLVMARWSRKPFVYLCPRGLKRQSDGLLQATVYSNQKRAALFVNGVLFSFQDDGPEFIFRDIPVKGFPLFLTAEAGECTMSVTFGSGSHIS